MLLKANSVTRAVAMTLALVSLTSAGYTQEAPPKPVEYASPYMDESKLDPAAIEAAKAAGAAMVRDILNSYETQRTPEMEQNTLQIKKKFDDIADTAIAGERDKVLEFLGIDPQADTGLYYFLSWSMPMELLRSYVIEAMWSGGTVVFKGVPPGKELGTFVINDLRQLVYGKGAAINISIDPRLFDAYAVTTVPSIVFTTVRNNMQCQGVNPVPVKVGKISASYDTCPELSPDQFWKIGGAVTSSHALQTFIDDGAVGAKPYQKALSRGFQTGATPDKQQKPFTGKWEDAISPSDLLAAQKAAETSMTPAGQQ